MDSEVLMHRNDHPIFDFGGNTVYQMIIFCAALIVLSLGRITTHQFIISCLNSKGNTSFT